MVHHHKRKRAVADGTNHIGDGGQCDGDRPYLFLDGAICGLLLGEGRDQQHQERDHGDYENTQQISGHGMHPASCRSRLWLPGSERLS